MRLQCKTVPAPLPDMDPAVTNAAQKILRKLSQNREMSKIVYPFIKITRGNKETESSDSTVKSRLRVGSTLTAAPTPTSGARSPALSSATLNDLTNAASIKTVLER